MRHCFRSGLLIPQIQPDAGLAFAAGRHRQLIAIPDMPAKASNPRLLIVPKVMYSRGEATNWPDPRLDICRRLPRVTPGATLIPSLRRVDGARRYYAHNSPAALTCAPRKNIDLYRSGLLALLALISLTARWKKERFVPASRVDGGYLTPSRRLDALLRMINGH